MTMAPANQRSTPSCPDQLYQRRRRRQQRREICELKFLVALLSLALSSSTRRPIVAAADDATTDMKVVGRYGPRQFRGLNRYGLTKPENIDYTKLTRINYGPFQINERGDMWGTDVNADPQILFGPRNWNAPPDSPMYCHRSSPDAQVQCAHHFYEKGLIGGAHANGVEVYSVVGGLDGSEKFSDMAADPAARTKFAQNAAWLMLNYDFDGMDMAWQFPNSLEDMSNYSLLLSEVRMLFDKEGQEHDRRFGLTATLPCSQDGMDHIDIPLLVSDLDEINLLSFDFHGPLDGEVGVNSPLYDQFGAPDKSVNACVLNYVHGGVPKNRINIGLAFYGHSFRGGKRIGDKCKPDWAGVCKDNESWQEDSGSPWFYNIHKKMHELTFSFDSRTLTPLAFNDRGVVSFDDPRSICHKAEYVLSNELNGFVIMDLTGDMLDDLSTPLLDALNLKLFSQHLDCGGKEFEELFQWREVIQVKPQSTGASSSAGTSKSVGSVATNDSRIKPSYRYTCGAGERNARDRCNKDWMDDIGCDTGTCPLNMSCFVVLCTKPKGALEQTAQDEVNFVESHSTGASSNVGAPKSVGSAATNDLKVEPTYRYTCGTGQGNARDRCNKDGINDIGCDTGTCPPDMICFVVLCTKPKGGIVQEQDLSDEVKFEAVPGEVKITKSKPKRKPRRKPVPSSSESQMALAQEAILGTTKAVRVDAAGEMSFSCGAHFEQAQSCGKLCPGGITDCPNGEFCFWLQCNASNNSVPTKAPVLLAPATTHKYQCGENRAAALTCSKDCGAAWECPSGQNCYNIPCPIWQIQ